MLVVCASSVLVACVSIGGSSVCGSRLVVPCVISAG